MGERQWRTAVVKSLLLSIAILGSPPASAFSPPLSTAARHECRIGAKEAALIPPTRHRLCSKQSYKVAALRLSLSLRQQATLLLASSTSTDASADKRTSNKEAIDENHQLMLDKERALGILVLLSVPLSWGTYSPVVKYLYELQPPVPGFVFSATYYLVASLSLLILSSFQKNVVQDEETMLVVENDKDKDDASVSDTFNNNNDALPILGGLELGAYLFFANGLQIVGLRDVPADRAGFLVQLTTVMVPVVQAALAGNLLSIPMPTWAACLLAFCGVIIMGLDGKDIVGMVTLDTGSADGAAIGVLSQLSSTLTSFTKGDLLIVLAAFVYTLHVVRLGKYAKETTPLKLAACKATTEAILSVALVAVLMTMGAVRTDGSGLLAFAQETGREISTFFSTISNGIASGAVPTSALLPAVGATLWTGWVTCAYTIYAQSFGQRRVSPTEANLIYTVQPIFTALFAWGLFGETLGTAGFVGAFLIGSAVYTVSVMSK